MATLKCLPNSQTQKDYAMMLLGGNLRVILVTIHTSLKSVPEMIKKESVLKTILLAKRHVICWI